MSDAELPITVDYEGGEPVEIDYYHIAQGLIRYEMVGETAVLSDEWNALRPKATVKPENIREAVAALPFVQAVEGTPDVKPHRFA
jgi:hypothetical protein